MGDGYYIELDQTESAAIALGQIGDYASAADDQLANVARLPAPATGAGIGPALAGFTSTWREVLPQLAKEMTALSHKATAVATVVVKVEMNSAGNFHMFAE